MTNRLHSSVSTIEYLDAQIERLVYHDVCLSTTGTEVLQDHDRHTAVEEPLLLRDQQVVRFLFCLNSTSDC